MQVVTLENQNIKICRACMGKSESLQHIFDIEVNGIRISTMFSRTSMIIISPMDGLPEQICNRCMSALISAFEFQQMCINSNELLRSTIPIMYKNEEKLVSVLGIADVSYSENTDLPKVKDLVTDQYEGNENKQEKNVEQYIKEEDSLSNDNIYMCQQIDAASPDQKENTKIEDDKDESSKNDKSLLVPLGLAECPVCQKTFDRLYRLKRHLNVHNPEGKPYECETCKQRYASESLLRRHSIVHSELLSKMATINKPGSFKCTECPRVFKKQESLSSHMRTHKNMTRNKKYPCEYCPKVFSKLNLLTRHVKSHAEMKLHKCNICEKTFSLSAQLIDHINKHNGFKAHVCHICQKGFQQSCTLKDHLRTHSGEQPFLCFECGKAFNNGSNLRQHLIRHTGVKPFHCPECPSRFTCKGGLKSHMATHSTIKPFICDICGAAFTKPYSLAKHKRIHTGEKPYACEVCNMRFNSSDHVKRHMRTHTGEKPYPCKLCNRAFAQSNDLVKHMRSHVGEKTYQCEECPDAFRLHSELKAHNQEHFKQQRITAGSDTNSNSQSSLVTSADISVQVFEELY